MDELQKHISKIRKDFLFGELNEKDIEPNPFFQFEKWLLEAVALQVPEAQAMNLATVSSENKPSSRIVYLREFKNHEFTFYSNYDSKKGVDLKNNPNACLNFFWPQLERQVRIEGIVKKASEEVSDNYFNSRPDPSKIGAWASQQSEKINSRHELEKKVVEIENRFNNQTIVRPPFWGGWVLQANYYEFWQGRKNRLHDRFEYQLQNNSWLVNRLSP